MGYIKYAENKENKKTEESIKYEDIYESPIGKIFISCNETGLTEVSFVKEDILADRKNTANAENIESIKKNISILTDTKRWLDIYFSGKEPGFVPSFHVSGTPFQLGVWKILQNPICKDSDLWGNCKGDCKRKRNITYVRTGSRRCCGE
jgi:methylated-DNA-[protein]-cysteine S-methyltransferase